VVTNTNRSWRSSGQTRFESTAPEDNDTQLQNREWTLMNTNQEDLFVSIRVHSWLRRQTGPCAAMTGQRSVLSVRYGLSPADPLSSICGYLWCGQFESL